MIDKVWVFGDSYMYGHELPFHDPDLREQLLASLGHPRLDSHGLLIDHIDQKLFDHMSQVEKAIDNYCRLCHRQCMGGYLASRLNVEYNNRAKGGYSNDAIMAELLKYRQSITPNSLVLVGMTYPARETHLHQTDDYGYAQCFNNYGNFVTNKHQRQYIMLQQEFGNDMFTKYLQAHNHVARVRELLCDIPHVIIDPVNIYRRSPEIMNPIRSWDYPSDPIGSIIGEIGESIQDTLLDSIKGYFDKHLFQCTLNHAMVAVRTTGQRYMELGGHPSKACHEWFVDHCLWPWLTDIGLVPKIP